MPDMQKGFERLIFQKFIKLLASHDVTKIDKRLHAYLTLTYGYCSIIDLKQFKKEYAGISGYRRFIVHFIRPEGKWTGKNVELNKKIHKHMIDNVYEYLQYCTKQEQLIKSDISKKVV